MRLISSNWLRVGLVLIAVAAIFAVYSTWRVHEARTGLEQNVALLNEIERYARQVQTHRQAPRLVSDREMELTLLARLIERAADGAGVPRQALDRIWPQPIRRVGDTAYQRKSTQLVVRGVTLPQAVQFLHALTQSDTPLSIDTLRLSAPRIAPRITAGSHSDESPGGTAETWTLETTVSHLLYQPTAEGPSLATRNGPL